MTLTNIRLTWNHIISKVNPLNNLVGVTINGSYFGQVIGRNPVIAPVSQVGNFPKCQRQFCIDNITFYTDTKFDATKGKVTTQFYTDNESALANLVPVESAGLINGIDLSGMAEYLTPETPAVPAL